MNLETDEKSTTISNPERVARIIHRIVQGGLPLMLRSPQKQDVAIKGKASRVTQENGIQSIRVTEISDKGMTFVATQMHNSGSRGIIVEFALSSSQLVFTTMVIAREANTLILHFPKELKTIERRKNMRFPTTEKLCAFVSSPAWDQSQSTTTSEPIFAAYKQILKRLLIGDISNGGVSVTTRFPGVSIILQKGYVESGALLHFPMQLPLPVTIEVKWAKKVKESITDAEGYVRQARFYKFGLEFTGINDEANLKIKQFIQVLSQASAI